MYGEIGKSKRDANRRGLVWYQSARPCVRGHIGLRQAHDGACCDCIEEDIERKRDPVLAIYKKQERAAGRQRRQLPADQLEMMQTAPDVVIDRGAAMAAGWEIYRTGRPCARGHAAWRFVSGGACTVCGAFD